MTVRILYVDDEADIREIAVMSLELDPGFVVRDCGSGAEAVPLAAAWSPRLVLLDVMMPVTDGPATLAALRAQPETANTPVAFVTARTGRDDVERLLALGACGVVPKPFDPMALAARVRALL